jgi:hypothetical protein
LRWRASASIAGNAVGAGIGQVEEVHRSSIIARGAKVRAPSLSRSMHSAIWLSSITSGGSTRNTFSPAATVSSP